MSEHGSDVQLLDEKEPISGPAQKRPPESLNALPSPFRRSVKSIMQFGLMPYLGRKSALYLRDLEAPESEKLRPMTNALQSDGRILDVSPHMFRSLIGAYAKSRLVFSIRWQLRRVWPNMSAHAPLIPSQIAILIGCFLVFATCIHFALAETVWLVTIVASFFFAGLALLRIAAGFHLLRYGYTQREPEIAPSKQINDAALPRYTVLIALYKEAEVLPQLAMSMANLDYPKDRLEVFFLVEAHDHETISAYQLLDTPDHFDLLIVPGDTLKTKPRALNFGLEFARGNYIAVFDAEDIPDKDQLKKAVHQFAACDRKVACLQARLHIFNRTQNWLTFMFASEYNALFRGVLPQLSSMGAVIPLGGTSNHFRADVLNEVGRWDPHNVTEDADLSIRLNRLGYTTQLLDSDTEEESLTTLGAWLKQRARWHKGWLQTYAVHCRSLPQLYRELGCVRFFTFHMMFGMMLTSLITHPLFMLVVGLEWYVIPERMLAIGSSNTFAGVALALTLMGYLGFGMLSWAAADKEDPLSWKLLGLISIPLYWMLLSLGTYIALYDFALRPFHWHKSPHVGKGTKKAS